MSTHVVDMLFPYMAKQVNIVIALLSVTGFFSFSQLNYAIKLVWVHQTNFI